MGELFGLLGHPVGHSMSPLMHNDAFYELRLPHHYQSFDVTPEDLPTAVAGLKALRVSGFNVTVPHKVAVMALLDEIDDEAKEIGAVNTVKNENGKLIGYNTDGRGYLQSLQKLIGDTLAEKDILIIGAGGAARGIAVTLARYGIRRLHIANRTIAKAETLARDCSKYGSSSAMTLDDARTNVADYDVVINTTSIGMSPNTGKMPLSVDHIKPGTVMSDLIYNPLQTKWLQEGEKRGAVTANGVSMFVGQGALAFETWTGQQPDRERMEQLVCKQLRG